VNGVAVLPSQERHESIDVGRVAEFVAQQAPAVVGHDVLHAHAELEEGGHGARRVQRAARAGDGHGD
jgi:hypothetical protein